MSEHCQRRDDIFVSTFEGLSLKQYQSVVLFVCQKEHNRPCNSCTGVSNVASEVISCGFMKLKSAFEILSPDVLRYKASEARRKLLRMPLACIGVGDRSKGTYCLYIVEKQRAVNYPVFQALLQKAMNRSSAHTPNLSKEEVKELLYLAEYESDKEMLKYVAVKASGQSNTKAKEVYGISDVQKRKENSTQQLKNQKQ